MRRRAGPRPGPAAGDCGCGPALLGWRSGRRLCSCGALAVAESRRAWATAVEVMAVEATREAEAVPAAGTVVAGAVVEEARVVGGGCGRTRILM